MLTCNIQHLQTVQTEAIKVTLLLLLLVCGVTRSVWTTQQPHRPYSKPCTDSV